LQDTDGLYSALFSALRHSIRRRIIQMLFEREMSFTGLLEKLGISSSHLTYHLASLDGLVLKRGSVYKLSSSGEAAVEMMRKLESPTNVQPNYHLVFRYLTCILLLLLTTLICVYVDYYHINTEIIKKGVIDAVFITSILLYPALPLVIAKEYCLTDMNKPTINVPPRYYSEFYYRNYVP